MGVGLKSPKAGGRHKLRNRLIAATVAVATATGVVAAVGAGDAGARINGTPGGRTAWVDGCGMPDLSGGPAGKVKVRYWKKPGNKTSVVLLDGMRARYDSSGWEINTNVQELVNRGVNVVEPIGGPASFYTNWNTPSNFNGQTFTYKWECVINNSVTGWMRSSGFAGRGVAGRAAKYAMMGISSGGNAALTLASKRRDEFYAAGSLSGYDFLSAPGMHTALRLAMLDVDPKPWNIDAMWGPPWDPRWYDNDPFLRLNRMQGLKLFTGSGNGLFGQYNALPNVVDDLFKGSTLEVLALAQRKAFEVAALAQGVPVMTYDAPGTHAWGYWQDMVWNALSRGFFK